MEKVLAFGLCAILIVCAGFLVIVIAGTTVEVVRSIYVPPIIDYPYSIGIGGTTLFCKSLDTELRVAYQCIHGNPNFLGFKIEEYHMTLLNNWVVR